MNKNDDFKKHLIYEMMNKFKNNKFNPNEDYTYIANNFRKLLEIELNERGINFNSKLNNLNNPFDVNIYENNLRRHNLGSSGFDKSINSNKQIERYKPHIDINISKLVEDLYNPSTRKRMTSIKEYYHTIFHELRHQDQWKATQNTFSSKDSIKFARDFALRNILGNEFYSSKDGNYNNYYIEKDANSIGYANLFNLLDTDELHKASSQPLLQNHKLEFANKNISKYQMNVDYKDLNLKNRTFASRDDLTYEVLGDLLKYPENKNIIELYPILTKEFNNDGSRKSLLELARNLKKENRVIQSINNTILSDSQKKACIKDCNEMYYELIYPQLTKLSPAHFKDFSLNYGLKNTKNLLTNIKEYYLNEYNKKIESNKAQKEVHLNNATTNKKYKIKEELLQDNNYYADYYSKKISSIFNNEKQLEKITKENTITIKSPNQSDNTNNNNKIQQSKSNIKISKKDIFQSFENNNISLKEIQDISKQTKQNIIDYTTKENINKESEKTK